MTTQVTAAVLTQFHQPFELQTLTLAEPAANEVLVKLHSVGICHTDIKVSHGYSPVPLPVVLGHEGAGVVVSVGKGVQQVAVGDHVVLSFNYCGCCAHCNQGHPAYCLQAEALNFSCVRQAGLGAPLLAQRGPVHGNFFGQSSFATHALVAVANVVKIPPTIPLTLPGALGCGVQTGAGTVLNVLRPQAGQALAVFGVGTVGLSAVMAAAMLGVAPLFAIDTNATRLVLAKELGATHVFNPTQDGDLLAWLSRLNPGGVQRAIDTTNNPTLLSQAFASLAKRGTLAHVGGGGKDLVFPGGPLLAGRTVTGVVQGDSQPQRFIPQLLDYYQQGRFPFDKLLKYYPFHAINQAVADMEAGRCIKPVLVFD